MGQKESLCTTVLLYVRIVTVWLLPFTHFLFRELLTQYKVGHNHDTSGLRLFHFLIYGACMLPCLPNNINKNISYTLLILIGRSLNLAVHDHGFNSNLMFEFILKSHIYYHTVSDPPLFRQSWSSCTKFQLAAFTPAQKNRTKQANASVFKN